MNVTAFPLEDRERRQRYDALFESCPKAFIQQSTYWAEVIADVGPDQPVFLLCEDEGVDLGGLPLYLTRHRLGNLLTSVPQAGPLGGVFVSPRVPAEKKGHVYRALLEAALARAGQDQCLTLTLISNPFDQDLALYEETLQPEFLFENFTQFIRLNEETKRSGGQKNNVARARKFGFTIAPCETARDLDAWYEIHCRRQTEIDAAPLDYRLFDNMLRVLMPRDKAWLFLARDGDTIAAGCLYVFHRSILDVFAISMDTAYAQHSPTALLADYSMERARARGVEIYNWQSSPARDSGVYRHKAMWGSVEAPYFFVTRQFCQPGFWRGLDPQAVRAEYPGRYVLPFPAFSHDGQELKRARYRKA